MPSSVPLGSHDSSATSGPGSDDSSQSKQLSIFCREVRNLLRSKPNCMIPFSKFVPAYHNHYGRQCCVYQYGYTKLIELLEAIPHVVQIVGERTNRYITLTHREQIKRFASDLIKVVKAQPGKRLRMCQMPRAYEALLGRTFRVQDYGTQNLQELLDEIWEGTINIVRGDSRRRHLKEATNSIINSNNNSKNTNKYGSNNNNLHHGINTIKKESTQQQTNSANGDDDDDDDDDDYLVDEEDDYDEYGDDEDQFAVVNNDNNNSALIDDITDHGSIMDELMIGDDDIWFEIPKRERSDKEIKRTKYFIWDVIKLLSTMPPHHSVPFSKFIPSYHHYYNRQCKVSVYGFSKLIDLFESISPDIVEIVDYGPCEEKLIKLASCHIPKQHGQQHKIFNYKNYHNYHRKNNHYKNSNNNYRKNSNAYDNNNIIKNELNINNNNNNNNGSDLVIDTESEEHENDDSVIDRGPTDEELFELEEELEAYHFFEAIKGKRSNRMAAIFS